MRVAAYKGPAEVIKLLLKYNANPNQTKTANYGDTPETNKQTNSVLCRT